MLQGFPAARLEICRTRTKSNHAVQHFDLDSKSLLPQLKAKKDTHKKDGILGRNVIDLTCHSSRIEGCRLTWQQTASMFLDGVISADKNSEIVYVDDLIETASHFRCLNEMIDQAQNR